LIGINGLILMMNQKKQPVQVAALEETSIQA
jgi:hypothetical protein